ncbi:hypothetical protein Q1695_005657 [Nippostrongylus brasiliensis]|nr:hypothetical protein Q1695_005657 [Nippostrongylus brasiliensis]
MTVFFIYSLYLVLYESSKQMTTYKYYILNIQISGYVESIYWTSIMSPLPTFPILGLKSGGFSWHLFRAPTQYMFAVSTLLQCCIDGAFTTALFYRYKLCLQHTPWSVSSRKFIAAVVVLYSSLVSTTTPLTVFAFSDYNSSISKLLSMNIDVSHLDESFILADGPTLASWAVCLILFALGAVVVVSAIIRHISLILTNRVMFSASTSNIHRSAITALLVQGAAFLLSTIIPVLMISSAMLAGFSSILNPEGELLEFGMKSLGSDSPT